MPRCPNCGSEMIKKYKKNVGFSLLGISLVIFLVDLIFHSLSIFLYITIAILCLYYFFSGGCCIYICKKCMSEFHE